jgi:hypothetical protein
VQVNPEELGPIAEQPKEESAPVEKKESEIYVKLCSML